MFDAGKEQREVGMIDRSQVAPRRFRTPCSAPGGEFVGRHWAGDAVALREFAAELQQHGPVFDGLDAFGNHLAAEGVGEAQHAAEDGKVVRVVEHVADEALVDLELCRRQTLEVGE